MTLALLGAGAWSVRSSLRLDASTSTLLAGDARSAQTYEKLGRVMGDRLPLGVLVRHEALFSDAGRDALFDLSQALVALREVNDVKSLTHSRRPVRKPGFSFDPKQMVGNEPFLPVGSLDAEAWAAVRAAVLSDPLAESVLVSADGRYAMVLAVAWGPFDETRSAAFAEAVEAVAETSRGDFDELFVGGFPFLEREVAATVRSDALRMLSTAAAVVALILALAFRSLWAVSYLLMLGAAGLCGVPLLMAAAGTGLNVYTALLLPLVAGLQLTFLAHFVAAVLDGERGGGDAAGVLRSALRKVSWPSTLAAVTTALGLLALRVSDVGTVREFGAVGAGAVVVALLTSLAPGWCISFRLGPGQAGGAAQVVPARATAYVAWLGRHRRALIVSALLLAALSVAAAARLRTDLRALGFLDRSSPSRQALTLIDEHLGGINAMQLLVDTCAPGGATRREVLTFLLDLAAEAESLPRVSHVYHLGQVYARLEQLWRGGGASAPGAASDPAWGDASSDASGAGSGASPDSPPSDPAPAGALPASDMQLALYTGLLKVVHVPLLDMLVDAEARMATVVVRAHDMPSEEWLAILDQLVAFGEERRPEGVTVALQAGLHELMDADRRMLEAQRHSLLAAALAVLLLLSVVLRSLRQALLTVLCNLLPMVLVLGVMGLSGVPLDSVTVMLGAVALGVAVDDAIHLLLWLRRTQQPVAQVIPRAAALSWRSSALPDLDESTDSPAICRLDLHHE
ncbi:MAG: hypothetical protein DRQ55_16440, partial [Planctomycetota bacterium]